MTGFPSHRRALVAALLVFLLTAAMAQNYHNDTEVEKKGKFRGQESRKFIRIDSGFVRLSPLGFLVLSSFPTYMA